MDTGYRQDSDGNRLERSRRRVKNGVPIQIYSRSVLDLKEPASLWGLCWQPDVNHIKGNDKIFRATLAIMAIEQAGESKGDAVSRVAEMIDPNCSYSNIENLRVGVYQYRQRCIARNVNLGIWLTMFVDWYWYYRGFRNPLSPESRI